MNIQRYVIPVAMASAIHAALFFGLTTDEHETRSAELAPDIKVFELEKKEVDPPVAPAEVEDTDLTVRPLTGGENPPDLNLPEVPVKKIEWTTVVPVPISARNEKTTLIPHLIGPGGPDGVDSESLPGNPIFVIGLLDRVPAARVQMPPAYPRELKAAGISGEVLVEFDVDRNGVVTRARALRSSRREFEAPAEQAVLKWRFEPGRRHGQAVPFRMTIPIEFSVQPD